MQNLHTDINTNINTCITTDGRVEVYGKMWRVAIREPQG